MIDLKEDEFLVTDWTGKSYKMKRCPLPPPNPPPPTSSSSSTASIAAIGEVGSHLRRW